MHTPIKGMNARAGWSFFGYRLCDCGGVELREKFFEYC